MANFSENQRKILAFPDTDYDALICDGAIRSGKTTVMSVAFILWAMRDFNGRNFGICSKTAGTAEKNIIKPLLSMQYLQKRFSMRYSRNNALVISSGKTTNTFYIYGGKDESSYQLIQGVTLAGVLLDEVALMPRSFVEQALARCSVDGRKLWFNCNPENQMHWFNQEWILQAEERNALHIHFELDDNPALSETIKAGYKNMYSGVFYDRYIRGLWVSAEGLIYDMFSPDRHVIDKDPEYSGDSFVSADFGVQNATVFLLWKKEKDSDRWIVSNEWYYSGREQKIQKTVSAQVAGLASILNGERPYVIVDPSAAALIAELRHSGYPTLRGKNDVLRGISDVSTMLSQDRIAIHKRCRHTIQEFGVYCWDERAANRGEDIPLKINDHCMDALRYGVETKHLVRVEKPYVSIISR